MYVACVCGFGLRPSGSWPSYWKFTCQGAWSSDSHRVMLYVVVIGVQLDVTVLELNHDF